MIESAQKMKSRIFSMHEHMADYATFVFILVREAS